MKDLMGTLSPAYGMMTGHGAFGSLADAGVGGVIPTMIARDRKKSKREEEEAKKMGAAMKKGGKVKASSASKRADGCAVRGKTKGKMV
jgi:hypothetical protein